MWLNLLSGVANKPFYVADARAGGEPSVRYIYHPLLMERIRPMPYRTVLVNEIVFDMDTHSYPFLKLITDETTQWLDTHKIPYHLFGSGGKGTHISIYCDFWRYGEVFGYDIVRVRLWEWMVREIGFYGSPDKPDADIFVGSGKPICKSCVLFSDASQGHIIRLCGGVKRWHKTLIESMPSNRASMYDSVPEFPKSIKLWHVPESIIASFGLKRRSCESCLVASDNRQFEAVEYPYMYPDVCRVCGAIYDYTPSEAMI